MKKNSNNSTSISVEMRELILSYMEACNSSEYAIAEEILQQIKEQGQIDYDRDNPID